MSKTVDGKAKMDSDTFKPMLAKIEDVSDNLTSNMAVHDRFDSTANRNISPRKKSTF